MTFIIHGCDAGRIVTKSRGRPASAGLLARKWTDQGIADVRIEAAGRLFDLATFHKQFVLTRHGMRERRVFGV